MVRGKRLSSFWTSSVRVDIRSTLDTVIGLDFNVFTSPGIHQAWGDGLLRCVDKLREFVKQENDCWVTSVQQIRVLYLITQISLKDKDKDPLVHSIPLTRG